VPPGEAPIRGDIVAQERDYRNAAGVRIASGHAAQMTSATELIQATENGLKASTLRATFPNNHPKALSPVRFIRYTGKGTNPWAR
jgi:hypothetical protein